MPVRPFTAEQIDNLSKGQAHIIRYGQKCRYKITPEQRERYEQAKRDGYLVMRSQEISLSNLFYLWCEMEQKPHLVIEKKVKNAVVKMDLICLDREFNDAGYSRVVEYLRECTNGWITCGTYTRCQVPIDDAVRVALFLLRSYENTTLTECHNAH